MPYATGIVSSHFMNHTAQLFYGLIVIVSTVANWFLHKVIDKPNIDQKELLEATAQYRKLLIPDLIIKGVGLILSLILYPPIMMYSVLIAAFYIITLKTLSEKRVNNKKTVTKVRCIILMLRDLNYSPILKILIQIL